MSRKVAPLNSKGATMGSTSDSGKEPAARREVGPSPGMPRWVKILLVVGLVVALAFLISSLVGVEHGPGRHVPSEGGESHSPGQHAP